MADGGEGGFLLTGALAAVAATATALALAERNYLVDYNPFRKRPADVANQAVLRQWAMTTREVRYVTIPQGHPDRESYSIPAGARKVPIVEVTRTALVPRQLNSSRGEDRTLLLDSLRGYLQRGGRGGIDPRCACLLVFWETGWGWSCWNYNWGNQKAQGSVYARSLEELLATREVWTTNERADGVYILRDRINSLDAYPSYSNHEEGAWRFINFFERNHYDGVIAGYTRGDLEGLLQAEESLARKGYSMGTVPLDLRIAIRQERARSYWRRSLELQREKFVR